MKIGTKITRTLLGVSLASIILVGTISFYFAKDALLETNGQQLSVAVSSQKNFITYVLRSWRNEFALLTSRTQLRQSFADHLENPQPAHISKIQKILFDAIKSTSSLERIELCDLQGNLVVFSGYSDVGSPSCKNTGRPFPNEIKVREVWLNDAGELYALMTGPLLLAGKHIGAMHSVLNAHEIIEIMQNHSASGETTETLIAERTPEGDARFITPLRNDPNPGPGIIKSNQTSAPVIQALLKKTEKPVGPEIIDYRGHPVLSAAAYIPEMGWGVVAMIDQEEVLHPINSLFKSILISTMIVFLLIMVIGVFAGHAITGPILRFVDVSRKVRDGDLSQKIEVSSRDEIGYLAESFNEMLEALQEKTALLARNEIRYRSIVDNIPDGLITIDEYGTVETFNKACGSIFGYRENEVIGKNINMLMPEPYFSEHDQYLKNYHDTGKAKIIGLGREVEGKRKDGNTFPVYLSVSEMSPDGRRIYSGIVRNITERKNNEKELREKEEKFRQTIANAPIGMALVGLDGNWLQVNAALCEIVGYSEKELLETDFQTITYPEDLEDDLELLKKLHDGKSQSYEIEKRYIHKDGQIIWVLLTVGVVRGDMNRPLYYISQIMDITVRKKAQEEVNAAREFQDLIMNTIPDLVFVKDEELRIVQANDAFLKSYPEDKRDKVIGYTTLESYDCEQVKKFTENDREALKTGFNEVEEEILFPNGEERTLLTKKIRFQNSGKPYLLGISRDISQIRTTQHELEQTNKELEKFAYIASHDLKAPMRGIDNLAQWIEDDLKDVMTDDVQEKINLLRGRVARLEALLEGILSYSRAGRIVDDPEKVDTRKLIQDIVDAVDFPKSFTIKVPEFMPTIYSVKIPLQQIFQNLISNATNHHDRQEGIIEVQYEDRGSFCEFSVVDDGPGIAPEFQGRAFEMFQTLQSRDKTEGTGLGMSIIKKLVEWQDGKVWIDSEKGKRGTAIRFLWPKVHKKMRVSYDRKTDQRFTG